MPDVLLRGCRLWGREESADVLVREGAIAAIGSGVEAPDAEVVDLAGRLVLPLQVWGDHSPRCWSRASSSAARNSAW